jgi:hypothetical protein
MLRDAFSFSVAKIPIGRARRAALFSFVCFETGKTDLNRGDPFDRRTNERIDKEWTTRSAIKTIICCTVLHQLFLWLGKFEKQYSK